MKIYSGKVLCESKYFYYYDIIHRGGDGALFPNWKLITISEVTRGVLDASLQTLTSESFGHLSLENSTPLGCHGFGSQKGLFSLCGSMVQLKSEECRGCELKSGWSC